MRRTSPNEYARLAGMAFGVLFMSAIQVAALLLLREGLVTFWMRSAPEISVSPEPDAAPADEPAPPADRTRPLAAMIDNLPDAWPQSGVSRAAEIWEVPVEGGLTRLMAIYRSGTATEIGPVRSARPYFLTLAAGRDAVYAHVGGSDEALRLLSTNAYGLDDANEFSNGASFWRDRSRDAPHNTYTSTELLRKLLERKEWNPETDRPDDAARSTQAQAGASATDVRIVFSANSLEETFRYDGTGYARLQAGRPMKDRDGAAQKPATLVVMEMPYARVPDPQGKGLIGIETIGAGRAWVFRDGTAVEGVWKKTSFAEPVRLTDADGAPLPLAYGQAWYAVILPNRGGEAIFE